MFQRSLLTATAGTQSGQIGRTRRLTGTLHFGGQTQTVTFTFPHQSTRSRRVPVRSEAVLSRTCGGGSMRLSQMSLLLVFIQTETGVTAFTFRGGEATAGTCALCDLLLLRPFRLFAVEQLELLEHRLLLHAADRMIRGLRCNNGP